MLNFSMGPTRLRRGLFFKFGHQLSQMSRSGVLDFVITYVTPGGLAKKNEQVLLISNTPYMSP